MMQQQSFYNPQVKIFLKCSQTNSEKSLEIRPYCSPELPDFTIYIYIVVVKIIIVLSFLSVQGIVERYSPAGFSVLSKWL